MSIKMMDHIKLPTVSIITISQYNRHASMLVLVELINLQTYSNIIEWVIVEGSVDENLAQQNQQHVEHLSNICRIPIRYVPFVANSQLGALRNRANQSANGDILVCMDDDDYYPPLRVEHAVERLISSEHLIAGCSEMFIYDYHLQKMIKSDLPVQNNVTLHNYAANNTMAYKREYLSSNSYDPNATFAEEHSFTKNFTNQLVQLDCDKTVICASHGENTYTKRALLISAILEKRVIEESDQIDQLIPESYRQCYRKIFYKPVESEYDIVYFTSSIWHPAQVGSLGGSEQAVVYLSELWQKMGLKVAVYLALPNANQTEIAKIPLIHNGVTYLDWRTFDLSKTYKTLIVWRYFGMVNLLMLRPQAKQVMLDLHDGCFDSVDFQTMFSRVDDLIDNIFVKSEFHKKELQKCINDQIVNNKIVVIPNGVRIKEFTQPVGLVNREHFRFCYASSYQRGLVHLLSTTWPIIYHHEPRAEFHIYYGLHNLNDQFLASALRLLLSQAGVMDHGRQSIDLLSYEKWRSNFHLYVTDDISETDCISVKESLVAGAIPIISSSGVFAERDGYHFDLPEFKNLQDRNNRYKELGYYCLELLLKSQNELNLKRAELLRSPTIIGWEEVAKKWCQYF